MRIVCRISACAPIAASRDFSIVWDGPKDSARVQWRRIGKIYSVVSTLRHSERKAARVN